MQGGQHRKGKFAEDKHVRICFEEVEILEENRRSVAF
jgi:hypothetical protein